MNQTNSTESLSLAYQENGRKCWFALDVFALDIHELYYFISLKSIWFKLIASGSSLNSTLLLLWQILKIQTRFGHDSNLLKKCCTWVKTITKTNLLLNHCQEHGRKCWFVRITLYFHKKLLIHDLIVSVSSFKFYVLHVLFFHFGFGSFVTIQMHKTTYNHVRSTDTCQPNGLTVARQMNLYRK